MRTVLITGANKSIGFEKAKILAKQGYHVYLGARDAAKGNEAVEKIKAEGIDNVEFLLIDVTDKVSIDAAQRSVAEKGKGLDILINNAGILGGYDQSAQTVDTALIREVFDTNFFGVINVTQAFLPLLKNSEQPVIVNVTSGLGSLTIHSDPESKFYHVKTAAYGPSKTALNAYTVVLAYELRDTNFKVNVVDPGYTATDFNNNSGPFKVEDSAAFVTSYATLGAGGPTGKYFSHEFPENNYECPW
ncbi:SDR family oxidoreductase [Mucilaginibacter daejeonensis]|uniref:SDR family oxidoreductase n=1 Tax=Mucilaginibacter daejeonensis TaxID=398049 RepID=UPI001D170DCD|nr:SDR family oxidoreductase [Mucilaginibacter daejeonensis]UEG53769.1 SDR family oxidoreductase [Mucilaginibacter daejeonensis]